MWQGARRSRTPRVPRRYTSWPRPTPSPARRLSPSPWSVARTRPRSSRCSPRCTLASPSRAPRPFPRLALRTSVWPSRSRTPSVAVALSPPRTSPTLASPRSWPRKRPPRSLAWPWSWGSSPATPRARPCSTRPRPWPIKHLTIYPPVWLTQEPRRVDCYVNCLSAGTSNI